MKPTLKKDALVAGIISIFIVLVLDMLLLIFSLSLLSDTFSSDSLYSSMRIVTILSLAFPAYVAARAARENAVLHSMLIGLIQALTLVALMTQTFSWEGTLQEAVAGRMPLVVIAVLALSFTAGLIGRWMNQKDSGSKEEPV